MRYKVTIHQELKYGETIVGYFDCGGSDQIERMYRLIDDVISHFKNSDASVEVMQEEEN